MAKKAKAARASASASTSNVDSQPSSSSSSSSRDLAALEAHFLATFGQAALPASRAGREGSDDSEGGSEGEDDEDEDDDEGETRLPFDMISSAQAGPSKAKVKPPAKAASRPKSAAASASSSRRPPETVVFEETGGRGRSAVEDEGVASDSKKKWIDFMKSKTANTGPDSMTSASEFIRAKVQERRKKEEDKKAARAEAGEDDEDDEAEQLTNDRQLSHLLNTTLFSQGNGKKKSSSSSSDKPDLSSHDTLARILEHSSSSSARKGQAFGRGFGEKALRASQLSQMPISMRQGIRSAAGDRAEKEMERNKEMGLLNSSYSRKFLGRQEADATMTGKRKSERDRVRGLGMGVGRFEGGTLKLSKDEVARMTGEGGRGGGGGKGGAKGAKRQKR